MRPEMLQSMLYYYVKEKTHYDEVDGCFEDGNLMADSDNPGHKLLIGGNINAESLSILPQSPLTPTAPATLSLTQRARSAAVGRKLAETATVFSTSHPEKSPIRFKNSCVFVSPTDQIVVLHIVPNNTSLDRDLNIRWKSIDRTAISGTHYVGSVGELVFSKDSKEKEIQIQLIPPISEDNDLRFQVELEIEIGTFNPNPVTINIKNINNFYDDEKQVLSNIFQSCCNSVADVRYLLNDCLNGRTFHTALTYVCSHAGSLSSEVGFAFELSRLCYSCMREDIMIKVLDDFFRNDSDEFKIEENS